MEPQVGAPAPAFVLQNDAGQAVSLASLAGRPVVLYFYPKADTPGCTKEACSFRDDWADVQRLGAVVLGVSPDKPSSLERFKTKYALPFPLLSDPEHAVAETYGVWVEKKNYGKTYMGIQRATFLIDKAGKIAKIWPKVKVEGHSTEVLEALKAL
jgi:peroxiredoxin Q/BCP